MYKIILEHYNIFVNFYDRKKTFSTSDSVKSQKYFLYFLFSILYPFYEKSFKFSFSSFDEKFLHHQHDVNSNEIQNYNLKN